jgi:hypothetical protein
MYVLAHIYVLGKYTRALSLNLSLSLARSLFLSRSFPLSHVAVDEAADAALVARQNSADELRGLKLLVHEALRHRDAQGDTETLQTFHGASAITFFQLARMHLLYMAVGYP